jgi:hypothetical protein
LAYLFLTAFWVNPLACWLINAFGLKHRLGWMLLFIFTCIIGYILLMLVVASHVVSDALVRRGIDASVVVGESEASDAGLALAPMLGVPVTLLWTAINFGVFSIIQWSYRTDFLSMLRRNTKADHSAEKEG